MLNLNPSRSFPSSRQYSQAQSGTGSNQTSNSKAVLALKRIQQVDAQQKTIQLYRSLALRSFPRPEQNSHSGAIDSLRILLNANKQQTPYSTTFDNVAGETSNTFSSWRNLLTEPIRKIEEAIRRA